MKQSILMNYFMLTILFMSSIMAISSTNMFMMWFSLELNMFSFVPVLLNKMSTMESDATMNYFFVQSLGSSLFLMMSMSMTCLLFFHKVNFIIIMLSLLLKMGTAPCHFWYPMVMEMSSWFNCLLLSTWQKLVPLFMLVYLLTPKMNTMVMLLVVSLSSVIGGMMGMSQNSTKKIMAYSSITHTGWMLAPLITNTPCMSVAYLTMYSIIIIPVFYIFNKMNINKVNHLWSTRKMSFVAMVILSILLLSLGGIPPLSGFIPKLMVMKALMSISNSVIMLLIAGSLMNLFFYVNISLNMLISLMEMKSSLSKLKMNMMSLTLAFNFLMFLIFML